MIDTHPNIYTNALPLGVVPQLTLHLSADLFHSSPFGCAVFNFVCVRYVLRRVSPSVIELQLNCALEVASAASDLFSYTGLFRSKFVMRGSDDSRLIDFP